MTMPLSYNLLPPSSRSIKIINKIQKPVLYVGDIPNGISSGTSGRGSIVVVADTGKPQHPDIICTESVNFSEEDNDNDTNGHATMVAGVLCSRNSKSLVGMAPDAMLLSAKVFNNANICFFNSLLSAVLWSIAKKADILLMSLGSEIDFSVLHDAIRKAYENNIVIIAAANNTDDKSIFPADYPEVMSVGIEQRKKMSFDIKIKSRIFTTTYLNKSYARVSGSSLAAAYVAGMTARIIQTMKKSKRKYSVQDVFKNIMSVNLK